MTCVWVTRTQPGADALAKKLRQCGIDSLVNPLIEIERLQHELPDRQFDLAVYLSQHAVSCTDTERIQAKRSLAIGKTTQRELATRRVASTVPRLASSEGLLEVIQGSSDCEASVLIVGGEGGREFLAPSLKELGYEVDELQTYRRTFVRHQVVRWQDVSIVEISSVAALRALSYISRRGPSKVVSRVKLIVPSRRIATTSWKLGFTQVLVGRSATVESYARLIRCLI